MFWYPHIKDGDAGSANYSFGSREPRSAYCEKCASAYRLLDLSHGAAKEEVKSKKWAFAELFSADRLGTMSEQARQLAEEQHKSINAACDQILRCPDCTRIRDGLDGSESRPAPEQATGATTKREESKPQPDKYSLAEQALVISEETNNKINAITFVREQTGWDLREAKDFEDSTAPEWRPASEQAAHATTKLEAFGETRPGKFSVSTVILVMVLIVATLAGWSLFSKHKAQMEAEEGQHLYQQQRQQEGQQRERVKEEQLRQQEEACAEKSAARLRNSAIRGKPISSQGLFVDASTTGIQRGKRSRIGPTVP
jgi:ribosomal protein L7/L12